MSFFKTIEQYWIFFSISILALISLLSLWPLEELPSVPGSDKTHHLIAYAVLAFPTALRKPNKWILILAFFVCYSGMLELLQPYVNRYGEWLDMLANTLGVISGFILATIINLFKAKPL